jgi:hypothetical protein
MKKLKLSLVTKLIRIFNGFFNENYSPKDEANALLRIVNLEKDTKHRLETVSIFDALFKAQMRNEKQQKLDEVALIDQHIPKRIEVSDIVVKYPECLSPVRMN